VLFIEPAFVPGLRPGLNGVQPPGRQNEQGAAPLFKSMF
jgi:hypothetical protein